MKKEHQLSSVTFQVRVTDFEVGSLWYEKLLSRQPDYVAHENFAEWELIPNAWLQVAKGTPSDGSGPLRLGVVDIETERLRIMSELEVQIEEIQRREGVPAAWCTFQDPYGNRIGMFQEIKGEK